MVLDIMTNFFKHSDSIFKYIVNANNLITPRFLI